MAARVSLGTANVQRSQLLLPFPTYGGISQLFDDNNKAKYYSMVLKAQKRFSKGLTFLSTFTWSRNWDESGAGPGNTLNGGKQGTTESVQHGGRVLILEYRYAAALGHCGDVELPFGKGKLFLGRVE